MRFHNCLMWILGFITAQTYYAGESLWMLFMAISVGFILTREPIWGDVSEEDDIY